MEAAAEHLENCADNLGLTKMAGAHHSNVGVELGGAVAQHHMARKHLSSLIGREGWDGTEAFQNLGSAVSEMGHEIKMGVASHAAMGEAMHDSDRGAMQKQVASLRSHMDKAATHGKAIISAVNHAIEARGGVQANEKVAKGQLLKQGETFQMFVPISKVEEQSDGTLMVSGWASVSDYVDSDGEVLTAAAMIKAMEDWAETGNIRFQHDPHKPIGTIRPPTIGKLNAKTGYAILRHPVTNTKAAWIDTHIVDEDAIKKVKSGVMTGFSVGGRVLPGGRDTREVDVDETGRILEAT